MIVECSILLLLLASCSAFLDSDNQDQIKRTSNQLVVPYWRLLQRNRKVMYAKPRMSLINFADSTRPLFMRTERSYLYDFDE